jgi:two-component system cell cycle sensor histidine kinase/response regulator CckA
MTAPASSHGPPVEQRRWRAFEAVPVVGVVVAELALMRAFRDAPWTGFAIAAGIVALGAAAAAIWHVHRHHLELVRTVARQAADLERRQVERTGLDAILDAALGSVPAAVAVVDRDLMVMRMNSQFVTASDVTPGPQVGRPLPAVAPVLASALESDLRRAFASAAPVTNRRLTGTSESAGGALVQWSASVFPFAAPAGGVAGAVVVLLDVTERLLLEDRLRQAQKMEAIGRLAGGVAHDFNNLLTIIRSYTDLLLTGLEHEDPRRYDLGEIGTAAERAVSLSRQLLTFTRPKESKPRAIDLNDIIRNHESVLRRVVPPAVDVAVSLTSDAGLIEADPGQVEQVLMNLVINAADAMPDGGHLVLESAAVALDEQEAGELAPGPYLRIEVKDTGVGMDGATIARIFDPFFTTKSPDKGTGLGLATVRAIVEQLQGRVEAESELGRGTVMRMWLPIAVAAPPVELMPAVPAPRAQETMLVVEDEVAVRSMLRRIFTRQGYAVLDARHGGEALAVAEAHAGPIHLLLSDVMMPEMGGRELAERFAVARPEARILLMSGYTDDDNLRRDLVSSGRAFIAKPFSVIDITRKVKEVLAQVPAPSV